MFSSEVTKRADKLIIALKQNEMWIVTAESCTGGLIAGALTSVAGSSQVVHGGFVTYANAAKHEMIGVPMLTLAEHGAVSARTAIAMAEGAREESEADIAISVTGIAGPDGGTVDKPVGLVFIGCATQAGSRYQKHEFGNLGRDGIREATIVAALNMAIEAVVSPHS